LRPLEEIERFIKEHRQNLGKWIAQKELANELTQLVHGDDGLRNANKCSDLLFNGIE
jgi:tyrosyl-tRNA synthetase